MDNINDLWKVPISELSLILLNNEGVNKNIVYKELKRRTSGLDERILSHDEWVVERRGLNRDNYLIGKKPSLQLLFETYINYVSDSKPYYCDFSQILFSEMPLCNQMFFENNFFYKIYNNEIFNLEKRIENNSNETIKEELSRFKSELIRHKEEVLKRINDSNIGPRKHLLTEPYILLKEEIECIKYFNDHFFKDYNTTFGSNFNPMETIYNELVIFKIIGGESFRLIGQKSALLQQSKNGIELDYSTEQMKKILKRSD